jgi:hypothetical protein
MSGMSCKLELAASGASAAGCIETMGSMHVSGRLPTCMLLTVTHKFGRTARYNLRGGCSLSCNQAVMLDVFSLKGLAILGGVKLGPEGRAFVFRTSMHYLCEYYHF